MPVASFVLTFGAGESLFLNFLDHQIQGLLTNQHHITGHPIDVVPSFGLGYYLPPYRCWYIIYHPKLQAGVLCTIPNSELGYFVPSQGMYWDILAKIWDCGPGLGPLGHCRLLAVSNYGPKFGLTYPLSRIWGNHLTLIT